MSDQVQIEGYQMSYTLKGIRVLSSVEPEIGGKKVVRSGNIYGLVAGGITDDDLVLEQNHPYVASFEYNNQSVLKKQSGMSDTATYHAMTMVRNGNSAKAVQAEYAVRSYAVLEDGSVVYSTIKHYSIFRVAKVLYDNRLMSNIAGHEYLYREILKVVQPDYEEVDYNWSHTIVK